MTSRVFTVGCQALRVSLSRVLSSHRTTQPLEWQQIPLRVHTTSLQSGTGKADSRKWRILTKLLEKCHFYVKECAKFTQLGHPRPQKRT